VTGASEYRIDVATTSDFTSGFVTNYNNRAVSVTSVSVIGLSGGTTYYVRVRAVNTLTANTVTSANSPTTTQVTSIIVPTGLTATNITTNGFTANWGSVIGATSYRLDVSTNTNFTSFVFGYNDKTVNVTSDAVTGLISGTTYYVRVRAVNSNGTSANSVTLTVIARLSTPIINTSVVPNSVFFSWNNVPGATEYYVIIREFEKLLVDQILFDTNYNIISQPSTLYSITVVARNSLTGAESNMASAGVLTPPLPGPQ
jgi:hypothetical protein